LNIRRWNGRLIPMVLAGMLLVLSGCAGQVAEEQIEHTALQFSGEAGYRKVAESGELSLYADPATAQFYCENTRTGEILRSNPENPESDPVANNLYQLNMQAQMIIGFVNDKLSYEDINNFVGAVQAKTYTYSLIDNGIRFDFDFTYEGFVVPMEITLKDGELSVSVPVDQIKEYKTNQLTECTLLPYMGATSPLDGGDIVLADGCGALIPITEDSAIQAAGKYIGYVYGRDDAYSQSAKPLAREQELTLPAFGIQSPSGSFLARIREGAALCRVTAVPAGLETEKAAVYVTATLRNTDTAVLQEMSGSARTVQVINPHLAEVDQIRLSWKMLGKDADYSDMAAVLREELEQLPSKPQTTDLYLELLLAVREQGTFIAIPMEMVTPLISFDDAAKITQSLTREGIQNLTVRLDGWQEGADYDKVPSLDRPEGKLGGSAAFSQLLKNQENVTFLPSVDYLNLYASGNGVSQKGDAVRDVSGGFFEQSEYLRSTFTKSQRIDPWYLAKSAVFARLLTGAAEKAAERSVGIFDTASGNILPSDGHRSSFRQITPTDRETAKNKYLSAYAEASEKTDLWFDRPAGYALSFAAGATRLPNTASGYTGFSEEIPLLQMVFHGRISYSGEPLNTATDYQGSLLRAAEFGEAPLFSLTELKEGSLPERYQDNFSASVTYWKPRIVEAYHFLAEARSATQNQKMTEHRKLAEGVYQSVFENGAVITVNYTKDTWSENGLTVSPQSYLVSEE